MTAAQTTDAVLTAIQNMEYPVIVIDVVDADNGVSPDESPSFEGPLGVLGALDAGGEFVLIAFGGEEVTVIADGGAEDLTIG